MVFIVVFCSLTVRINWRRNSNRPADIAAAPINITQAGISTFAATWPGSAGLTRAAYGPTAFATSLDPWTKDNRAAEQISGMVNRERTDLFLFSMPSACLRISGLTII